MISYVRGRARRKCKVVVSMEGGGVLSSSEVASEKRSQRATTEDAIQERTSVMVGTGQKRSLFQGRAGEDRNRALPSSYLKSQGVTPSRSQIRHCLAPSARASTAHLADTTE